MEGKLKKNNLPPLKVKLPPKVFEKKQNEVDRQLGGRDSSTAKASPDINNVVPDPEASKGLDVKGSRIPQSSRKGPTSQPSEGSPDQKRCTSKKPINIYYSEHHAKVVQAEEERKNALQLNRFIQHNKKTPVDNTESLHEWLEPTASLCHGLDLESDPSGIVPEALAKDSPLPRSFDLDSDDGEVVARTTNPFAQDYIDESSLQQDKDESNIEVQLAGFNKRLQLHGAVPESCLSDAIFKMDRPNDAIELGEELPPLALQDFCTVGSKIVISVTEVYGPFHFWFNFVNQMPDTRDLKELNSNIAQFYSQSTRMGGYDTPVTPYFLKEGYICAARKDSSWRRARIVATPPPKSDIVSIYYVDFGSGEEVSPKNLKFLPNSYAHVPALGIRGSMSHIHPLGLHWPPDAISHFRQLVEDREIQAIIDEVDPLERVLSMRLAHDKDFAPSLNRLLVEAGLAGRSFHFTKDSMDYNDGRRIRYLRERLPTFEMLETRLFPMNDEEFEDLFDDIIYVPSFHSYYEVPEMQNPFHARLREALVAWMPSYRDEQQSWINKYKDSSPGNEEAEKRRERDMEEAQKRKEMEAVQKARREMMEKRRKEEIEAQELKKRERESAQKRRRALVEQKKKQDMEAQQKKKRDVEDQENGNKELKVQQKRRNEMEAAQRKNKGTELQGPARTRK
ncbi:uncharacterized protein Dana_GF20949 [Drosophila ananassae]|uniref:Tudor domain-containing protein n=1 Tax=Drosophila ananassae TaxID=7217 RepID=B3MRR1_DROAN|nr:uncharacterized protein LOC6503640 [Drosophila ananassae]EDV34466.2 uncharacterized protein Dana_GF20949 [Drosophila ananassae]